MSTVRNKKPASSYEIHKVSVRRALSPRREPYWGPPLATGQHVGFRKIAADRGTWIARFWIDGKQETHALGFATDAFGIDQAKAAAVVWFKDRESGVATGEVLTVSDACRRYVEERTESKSPVCGHDAEMRFERCVYDTAFGARRLSKLREAHIKAWRARLGLTEATANRTLVALKAALNLAIRERNVSPAQAIEWRNVAPFKNASRRRDLFLDLEQRRALLGSCSGAIRDLIEGVMLTGARAGELVNATRRQFDARTGSISLTGKTGTRNVALAPAAVVLFTRLAKSKLPGARLLARDDGRPWAHSDWDELVRAAATAARLPSGVCLYTLRHSFISAALASGMTTLSVARLVGTSLAMIDKHYGHVAAVEDRKQLALVAFT